MKIQEAILKLVKENGKYYFQGVYKYNIRNI